MPKMEVKNELPANLSFRPKPGTYEVVKRANAIGLSNSEFFDKLIVKYGPRLIAEMAQERRTQLEEQIALIEQIASEGDPAKPIRTAKRATRKRA